MDSTALIMQSRFAGLTIEDDVHPSTSGTQRPKISKKKPKKNEASKRNNNQASKKKAKESAASAEQWELWKQKDEELADVSFESDLQQAILLSKLDYEENKDVYLKKKESDNEKSVETPTCSKKLTTKNTMSLDEFHEVMGNKAKKAKLRDVSLDATFFDKIKEETRIEFIKDKINNRLNKSKKRSLYEAFDKTINDIIEEKEQEILALQQEVDKLKSDLGTLKMRNKTLCNILGQGKMKDKAEILAEMENLRANHSELINEIEYLHTELEKERSKNTSTGTKDKQKKKVVFADK